HLPQAGVTAYEPARGHFQRRPVICRGRAVVVAVGSGAAVALLERHERRFADVEPRSGNDGLCADRQVGVEQLLQVGRGGEAEIEVDEVTEPGNRRAVEGPLPALATDLMPQRAARAMALDHGRNRGEIRRQLDLVTQPGRPVLVKCGIAGQAPALANLGEARRIVSRPVEPAPEGSDVQRDLRTCPAYQTRDKPIWAWPCTRFTSSAAASPGATLPG